MSKNKKELNLKKWKKIRSVWIDNREKQMQIKELVLRKMGFKD